MSEWLGVIIGPIIAGVAAIVVGWFAGKHNVSAKKIEGATPSYQALDARVEKLEGQVGKLRNTVEHLEDELEEARGLAKKQHDFIENYIPMDVKRPFSLPPWLD